MKLLAALLFAAGLISTPAHASTPFPNQSTLWSRNESEFGSKVAIASTSGDTIAVLDVSVFAPGPSAFVYQFTGGAWTEVARLSPSDAAVGDPLLSLGLAVSDSGDFVALSTYTAIYVFQKPAGGWHDMSETAKLTDASSGFLRFLGGLGANGGEIAAVFSENGLTPPVAVYAKPVSGWKSTSSPDAVLASGFDGNIMVSDSAIVSPLGPDLATSAVIFDKPASGWMSANPDATVGPPLLNAFVSGLGLSGSTLALTADGCPLSGCGGGDIERLYVYQGPAWGSPIATLSTSTTTFNTLGSLLAVSPGFIVAGSTFDETLYGFQKPVSGWVDATESFTLSIPSPVGNGIQALAMTDSTLVASSSDQPCPAGLVGTTSVTGSGLLCPLVYAYDSGAVAPQTADLLVTPAIVGGVAFVGKQFQLTYDLANTGDGQADNVQVVIPLPTALTGITSTVSQGSCQDQTAQMVCQLGTLAAAASAQLTLTITAPANGQVITQSVTASTSSPERSIRDGAKSLTYRVDTPPVASGSSISAIIGRVTLGDFLAVDADGDKLTYRIVTQPKHGSVSPNPGASDPNEFEIIQDLDYVGSDSFSFVANDGFIDSNVATVQVTANPRPLTPTGGKGAYGLGMDLLLGALLALRRRGPRVMR